MDWIYNWFSLFIYSPKQQIFRHTQEANTKAVATRPAKAIALIAYRLLQTI